MKRFSFPLDQYQLSMFKPAVREKIDVILIWMHALKIVQSYSPPEASSIAGKLDIRIDKMSRMFVEYEGKCYSVNFPFTVLELADGSLQLSNHSCQNIDNIITSEIISLIRELCVLSFQDVLEFAETIFYSSENFSEVWPLLRELMLTEDGYVRCDHDPANVNGKIHPLDHIDIFYSNTSTTKLGLYGRHSLSDIADILDRNTDCRFLTS